MATTPHYAELNSSPLSGYTAGFSDDASTADPFSPLTPVNSTPISYPYDTEVPNTTPSAGVMMEWHDINFVVTVKENKEKKPKSLLTNVHGKAIPGQIVAIMGGSGAGKTTLLDSLAGRLRKVEGTLLINGNSVPPGSTGGHSKAYVFQGDNLHPTLTVGETLMFAAHFQLPAHMSTAERREVVQRWMKLLGIAEIEHVKVGDEEKKGISGGQRRRLSIGIDLLKDPKVIFLDEPISGLDSTSAYKVVKAVHDITVCDNRTTLMTIHQPSPRILELLGNILILSQGKAIFQGHESEVGSYLQECAGLAIPSHVSPIEFFLDFVDGLREEGQSIDPIVEYHRKRTLERAQDTPVELLTPTKRDKSHFKDYWTLTRRTAIIMMRTPELFIGRAIFCLVCGFLFSTIFWQLKSSWTDLTSIAGFYIMGIANLSFTSTEVMPMFHAERIIIRREYFQEAYHIANYILSQSTVWTLTMIPNSLLWTLSSYWSVGLTTDDNGVETFLFTWFLWFGVMFVSNAFSMLMSAVIPNPMSSASASTAVFAFMLVLSGFFVPRSDIPPYWIWFYWLSQFMYAQNGFLVNYFGNMGDTQFGCPPPEDTNASCYLTNTQVLDYYNAGDWNKWTSIGALIGFGLLWRVVHCVVLFLRFRGLRVSS